MLTNRQKIILKAIIDNYITSGRSVSSGSVAKSSAIKMSSATVRNEMNILRGFNYISSNSNVSGSKPTILGYQFYVDKIMKPNDRVTKIKLRIKKLLTNRLLTIDQIIEGSCKIISEMSAVATVNNHSDIGTQELRSIQLIHLKENELLLIVVTNTGQVINKKMFTKNENDLKNIKACISILNKYLIDTPISEIKSKIEFLEPIAKETFHKNEVQLQNIINLILNEGKEYDHITGLHNIVKRKEYHNYETFQKLLKFLENKSIFDFVEYGQNKTSGDVQIKIGDQLTDDLKGTAGIYGEYKSKKGKGKIAIIGPLRLEYENLTGLLKWFIKEIEKI